MRLWWRSVCAGYKYNIGIINKANNVLSTRIELSHNALVKYKIPLFGKKIKWIGNGGLGYKRDNSLQYNFVDNAYLKICFDYGIVLLFILTYFSIIFTKEYYYKNKKVIFINILILLWGLIEPNILEIEKNIFLVYMYSKLYSLERFNKKWLVFDFNEVKN